MNKKFWGALQTPPALGRGTPFLKPHRHILSAPVAPLFLRSTCPSLPETQILDPSLRTRVIIIGSGDWVRGQLLSGSCGWRVNVWPAVEASAINELSQIRGHHRLVYW